MSGFNISCHTRNLDGVAPPNDNYAYIESHWAPANVTAMTRCCAPQVAKDEGCYTWCRLGPDDDIGSPFAKASWETAFQNCLGREGRQASNESFVAPRVIAVKNASAAPGGRVGDVGVKGVVFVVLGVLSWVLAG
ncbi:hypothetical protein PG985_001531 [Apiospora marii]|uniref:uncharacterized protein n=1 Tax=Apiospora marii TaxID=335849 RepID=UPI00312D900D